jgi:predicted GIY-YIG superfamily endonuclease
MGRSSRRFTLVDPWIIGGAGRLADLFVVGPWTKLAIDALIALLHPHKFYRTKKAALVVVITLVILLAQPTQSPLANLIGGLFVGTLTTIGLTVAYRRLVHWRNNRHYQLSKPSEPWVPLDITGNPDSAILLTRSVLIGGESGSGKSNAVWMLLEGLVKFNIPFKLHVIDPAGGVELADLEDAQPTILYVDRPTEADNAILDFKDKMDQRLQLLKRLGYKEFDPTKPGLEDEAWHYLLIDELLLCAQQLRQGVLSPLGDILATGRKAGFLVIACTQLGQKSTLGDFRDLFPQRVCFGTRTQELTDAILGTGATNAGATAHLLIDHIGDGFLWTKKAKGYQSFHTRHITDTQTIVARATNTNKRARTNNTNTNTNTYAVYKLFGEDTILYVGVATNPDRAIQAHRRNDEWFELVDPSKTLIEWYQDHNAAYRVQQETIYKENPLWNILN